MKRIITMVGTSIFENYKEQHKDVGFAKLVENLRNIEAYKYNEEIDRIREIKEKLNRWINKSNDEDKEDISAEIKSIIRLKEQFKDYVEMYFLCSDTILSKVAGEILEEFIFNNMNMFNDIDIKNNSIVIVESLVVDDGEKFKKGMNHLVDKVYSIANEYWDDVVINITGGFKATIPYLTILAQVNKCPIYYIFETTDALIKIPYIPININWDIFEKNEKFFMGIEKGEIKEFPKGLNNVDDLMSIISKEDIIHFNPLGVTLWEKYKERFELFYVSKVAKEYISLNREKRQMLDNYLMKLKKDLEENPSHSKLHHELKGIDIKNFDCFKDGHIRMLYQMKKRKTRYGVEKLDVYVGDIAIDSDVHNAESEYVGRFKNNLSKIEDLSKYEVYRIEKQSKRNIEGGI
ncbi:CRISPR-associated protein, APE2256 family [Thermoanaerobacterium thermosaccharolyticum DSM 571]|uniref:CRISPR-associated protein, APE2256 family n=1 Tax=Thermoanaerobacterium thermosaccharolyticum (strain ATCC 7956 / DSM 571 / NCIMB 9385 / NCA 3814 / NCTC 13789 / WDCM 00135 / 2032) TaxID=580327 RepID=D9TMI6_THETC|nr:putative CRISPR-associated protein [Thermoanaerobacterium thermosaccharolyticum]ADL68474.1 CRISPR-associated protein, APE2256 family [Thermoanaerobacterium thermosaccharolyticum DSM 571]MCP2239475.1 putative CRISPR-associated protein (TIGR02619 family) [Thermoanaerobacterium thermosaccharolyticum]